MYEKVEKSFKIWVNQINEGVLLLVPKLITVGEGIPTPDDVTGCSHDVISGRNPQNNKLKYRSEHANSANKSGTI